MEQQLNAIDSVLKAEDAYNPFALPRPWIVQAQLDALPPPEDGLFQVPEFQIPPLEFEYDYRKPSWLADPFRLPGPANFHFPVAPVDNFDELPDGSAASQFESEDHSILRDDASEKDIWGETYELGPLKDEPKLLTWDAFSNPNNVEPANQCISEAGPAVFDAALVVQARDWVGAIRPGRVLQSDALLNSLRLLALGRPSVLFPLHEQTKTFDQAIDDGRMSGYSLDCFQSLIEDFLEHANALLRLRRFVDRTYVPDNSFPSRVALANVADVTLTAVEEQVLVDSAKAATLLQLQACVWRPKTLICSIDEIVEFSSAATSNEQLLSRVFEKLQYLEDCGQDLTFIYCVFTRVASPWLDGVMQRVGLRNDGLDISAQVMPGDERKSAGESIQANNVPSFLSVGFERMIQDTQRCLQFLRSFQPDHPLANPRWSDDRTPRLEWTMELENLERISTKADLYHEKLTAVVAEFDLGTYNKLERSSPCTAKRQSTAERIDWPDFGYNMDVEASIAILSADPKGFIAPVPNELLNCISSYLTYDASWYAASSSVLRISLNPLLSAQHTLLTTTTLRSILHDHGLQQHLAVVRSFHLFGSGDFASNLSRALFSADIEAAERTKGVVRTGIGTMGLKLGSGQRRDWPPASSELTLALMNVLNNSWLSTAGTVNDNHFRRSHLSDVAPHGSSEPQHLNPRSRYLPGGLSFAIRDDVSPEEIEKILDPQSIFALDFLRLSYHPPAALADLFTPPIMEKYDRIFNMLLRVLRMQFVIGELLRETMLSSRNARQSRAAKGNEETLISAFRRRATHFVTALCSHFLDTGISKHWHRLEDHLAALEAHVASSSSSSSSSFSTSAAGVQPSRDQQGPRHAPSKYHNHHHHQPHQAAAQDLSLARLAHVHESVLTAMTTALLLRKRQRKLAAALEEILGDILGFAALLRERRQPPTETATATMGITMPPELSALYASFDGRVARFKDALARAAEKGELGAHAGPGDGTTTDNNDDDGDRGRALRELLERL